MAVEPILNNPEREALAAWPWWTLTVLGLGLGLVLPLLTYAMFAIPEHGLYGFNSPLERFSGTVAFLVAMSSLASWPVLYGYVNRDRSWVQWFAAIPLLFAVLVVLSVIT